MGALTVAFASESNAFEHTAPQPRQARPFSCGSTEPPSELRSAVPDCGTEADDRIEVNVFVHVVTSAAKQGLYTRDQVRRQIVVMNKAYGPVGIEFVLKSIDFTKNTSYAYDAADMWMKKDLRMGTYQDLNLYFESDIGRKNGLLGRCNFPTNVTKDDDGYIADGCVILADTLPGGSAAPYNMGGTATHETGHWLGLLHVFRMLLELDMTAYVTDMCSKG